jgi:carbonic anhydrase
MSHFGPLLDRNPAFAATGAHEALSPLPRHQVLVLTCVDSRVEPAGILGIELGDALVVRNTGGRVTDEVIEEIAFLGYVTDQMPGDEAPPFEVAVVHHTECGAAALADDAFRQGFAERVGADEARLAARAVADPVASVRADVDRLLTSPLRPGRVSVSGHVYDVGTGLVQTVVPSSAQG